MHLAVDREGYVWAACEDPHAWRMDNTSSHSSANGYNLHYACSNSGVLNDVHNIVIDDSDQVNIEAPDNVCNTGENVFQLPASPNANASVTSRGSLAAIPWWLGADSFNEVIASMPGTPAYWTFMNTSPRNITFTGWTGAQPGQMVEVSDGDNIAWNTSQGVECDYHNTCSTDPVYNGVSTPVGAAVDGASKIWVANQGNHSISLFSQSGDGKPQTIANFIYPSAIAPAPTSIAVDQSDNVGFNNVGSSTSLTLTELVGAGTPTIQPIVDQIYGGGGQTNQIGTRPTQ